LIVRFCADISGHYSSQLDYRPKGRIIQGITYLSDRSNPSDLPDIPDVPDVPDLPDVL